MAEIKVEKKNNNYWIWIVLGLILAAMLVYFLMNDDDDTIDDVDDIERIETDDNGVGNSSRERDMQNSSAMDITANGFAETAEFTAFIGDKSKMGIDHEYTNEAMTKLVDATIEHAKVAGVNIDNELRSVNQKAEAITENPMDTNHSDKIRQAYLSVTDAIEKVQMEKFPQLSDELQEVRSAAESIDPKVLTLDQKEKVNGYFDEAAELLQQMI